MVVAMMIRLWLWWGLLACMSCGGAGLPGAGATGARTSVPAETRHKEGIAPEAATGFRDDVDAVRSGKHMVAAANPHASRAGIEILRAGGSAVDAAIAMALVLTLVEPQSSGVGGGAFMLHYSAATKRVAAYDGREVAPAAATPDMFMSAGKPRAFFDAVVGGLSVGVPSELRMLELAHRAHGKLPWKRLFEPAIRMCVEGFEISPRLHALLAGDEVLPRGAVTGPYFYEAGKPKPVGTRLRNPELAEVLRAVADGGADAFYTGAVARDIVEAVRTAPRNPGRLALGDLSGYRAVKREAVCLTYRSYRVCGFPPPSSGGIATLQILGLLERFDVKDAPHDSVAFAHLFAEAGRLAYADRDVFIADPDFVEVPSDALLDAGYLAKRSASIDPARSMGTAAPGAPAGRAAHFAPGRAAELPSTSHLVAVDGDGNVVSMTASIESAFGSHVMVRGFLLNNELTDFSFVPEVDGKPVANRVEPGKRPRSSMAPVIVLRADDDRFVMALGSPGGSRIIAYVARVLFGVLDHGMALQAAVDQPHIVNRNGATELERNDDAAWQAWLARTQRGLEALGHEVQVRDLNSGLHAILRDDAGYVGAADPRREGLVIGD